MATPMMQQYRKIKQQYPEDVIFFRMGDFFEMFHEDAKTAHKVLGITLTRRAHGKGEAADTPLAGFPHHQLESYLAKMTRAGYRVVVVEQVEDPKKAKGLVRRDIVQIVTAGTNFSQQVLDAGKNQFLAGVVKHGNEAGIAFCDATTGEFTAASVAFPEVRDLLDLVNPAEVVLPDDQRDDFADKLPKGAMRTQLPPWIFETSFARDTLTGHFKVQSLKGYGVEDDTAAIGAAGAVLHYVRENLRVDPEHIKGLSRLPLDDVMLLDSSTRRNLELIEPLWGSDRSSTLLHHIDKTVTPFGRRQFTAGLLRPLLDKASIERRHDAVEDLFHATDLRRGLRERFRELADLERLVARIAAHRAGPRDLAALRDTLLAIPGITGILKELAKADALTQAAAALDPLDELVELLKRSVADDPPAMLAKGGAIREGYHEELDEVRQVARGGKEYILSRQQQERNETGINSLAIKYNKVFGYYIEVSKANLDKVPEHYIRKQTLVNAERYITPDLKEWEDKILTAEERLLALERELFDELCVEITQFAGKIQFNARVLAMLDFLAAAAELAVEKRYTRPAIREDSRLLLVKSRHPVVENLLPVGDSFVANDLDIDSEKRSIALVTGPNMGGKSTYLRQVGLIVMMAQAGLFVPAEQAEIPITDRIFTRVGASDNLAAGESTFLVEMHEAANILHNATGRSLILLDEIGRGTSTFDGLSLAWSIVEYLHDYPGGAKPKTLFATHYHELTELERRLERVFNLHVQVKEWGDRVIFLRKVQAGISGASYGIQVARLAGLPQKVIDRAKDVLAALEASDITPNNLPHKGGKGARSGSVPPEDDPLQLTLFTKEERAIRDAIGEADLDNMTPLEALRFLAELKDKFNSFPH